MADRNVLQAAGDFDLDGALIIGSSGRRINIIDQLRELNIYQSIDAPFMSGNIVLADSAGVAELLPILGQERLLFSLKTPGHRESVSFNDYHAIIYNVQKRFHTTEREQTYLLNFTTLDHYKNLRTKISASFKGTISEIVLKILKDENYLGTNKPISIEETLNNRNFVIPNMNPFRAINLLKREAISKDEQAPYFLFFENQEGYHFRSFDSLIGYKQKTNMPHKRVYKFQPPAPGNIKTDPELSLGNILHWELTDNQNSFLNVKLGMTASTLYTHDIFNKNIQKFEYSYMKRYSKRNNTNQEHKNSGTLLSQAKIDDKTISEHPNSKIFVHPTASEKLHTEGTDNNAEEWLQENRSRLLEMEYFTIKIETYGDTDITVGDLVNIKIPSNKPLAATGGKEAMDPILSGRYLITSLHHQVVPTDQMHTMVMTAMKDSVSAAAPVKDLQWLKELKGKIDFGLKKSKSKFAIRTATAIVGVRG